MEKSLPFPGNPKLQPASAESLSQALAALPEKCCARCDHFFPVQPELCLCRRYPPVLTLLAVPVQNDIGLVIPKPTKSSQVAFTSQPVFPPVNPNDCCGEFFSGVAMVKNG